MRIEVEVCSQFSFLLDWCFW